MKMMRKKTLSTLEQNKKTARHKNDGNKTISLLTSHLSPTYFSRKAASRIIRVVAGVTSRSTSRVGFAIAHTAPYRKFGFTLAEGATHVERQHNKRKIAFTLAEVLITLGIIGVVAAMTMPSLIQHYKKQVTVNRLKKAYSEIYQAIKLSEAENGTADTWSFPVSTDNEGCKHVMEDYLLKYFKTVQACDSTELQKNPNKCGFKTVKSPDGSGGFGAGYYVLTPSGYGVGLLGGGFTNENDVPHVHIIIDTDGPERGKNMLCSDIFRAILRFAPGQGKFLMYGFEFSQDRDVLMDAKNKGNYCGAIIQSDGWEIKDDYPYKL